MSIKRKTLPLHRFRAIAVRTLIAIRMKRAKTLLKNGNMTVENISHAVGYQNVENFSRQFKKNFQMTPVQYRNQNRVS